MTCSRAFDHLLLLAHEQRGEAPFFTSRLLDFVGVVVLSFFSGFFLFSLSSVEFLSERQRHKNFQREKKRDDGGGRAKREFCVQEFFLFWSFLSFDMPVVLYVWQTTNDDSIRSAPFLYHNPHRIV